MQSDRYPGANRAPSPSVRRNAVRSTLPVLMYHSAPASGPGSPLAVPRPLIDRQWRALRSDGWQLQGLTDALGRARTDPDARIVGVTFDDGFSNFLGVLDLLSAHEAQATLYLPTSHLDAAERADAALSGAWGPWLSWADVARLPRELVEVGSHAHVHRPLDVLRRADARYEVRHSRQRLAERIGTEPVSFCYPNGYSSRSVRHAVSAAGYANACILGHRLADPDGDAYAVPRLQVTPAHDEAGVLSLVSSGETGWTPRLKRLAYPAWRVVRFAAYRGSGAMLT
jgi:peptidoglycan/xylan/chitin deacetylase (PgdA/CDA1 family)